MDGCFILFLLLMSTGQNVNGLKQQNKKGSDIYMSVLYLLYFSPLTQKPRIPVNRYCEEHKNGKVKTKLIFFLFFFAPNQKKKIWFWFLWIPQYQVKKKT